MAPERWFPVQPLGVGSLLDGRMSGMSCRDSHKLSVRFIEIAQFGIIGETHKTTLCMVAEGNLITPVGIGVMLQSPFNEHITRTFSFARLRFIQIFS